jgi:hypothetical protein
VQARSFIVLYCAISFYFAHKMIRLVIILAPAASIACGIAVGVPFDWAVAQLMPSTAEQELTQGSKQDGSKWNGSKRDGSTVGGGKGEAKQGKGARKRSEGEDVVEMGADGKYDLSSPSSFASSSASASASSSTGQAHGVTRRAAATSSHASSHGHSHGGVPCTSDHSSSSSSSSSRSNPLLWPLHHVAGGGDFGLGVARRLVLMLLAVAVLLAMYTTNYYQV